MSLISLLGNALCSLMMKTIGAARGDHQTRSLKAPRGGSTSCNKKAQQEHNQQWQNSDFNRGGS